MRNNRGDHLTKAAKEKFRENNWGERHSAAWTAPIHKNEKEIRDLWASYADWHEMKTLVIKRLCAKLSPLPSTIPRVDCRGKLLSTKV